MVDRSTEWVIEAAARKDWIRKHGLEFWRLALAVTVGIWMAMLPLAAVWLLIALASVLVPR